MSEYGAFGFRIVAPEDLLLALPAPPGRPRGTVRVVQGLPRPLEALFPAGLPFSLGKIAYGRALLDGISWYGIRVPSVASYLVEGQRFIHIEPAPGADAGRVSVYLVGLVLSFLCRQEDCLVFHGSAVTGAGGALLLLGNQGAGKSTTAAALALRGYPLLCDDSVPVAFADSGPPGAPGTADPEDASAVVLPGIPRPKLLPDAFERLVGDPVASGALWDGVDKYQADVGSGGEAAPLAGIVILEPVAPGGSSPGVPERVSVRGAARITALRPHVQFLSGIDDPLAQTGALIRVAGSAPVLRLSRPAGYDTLESVIGLLREILGPPPAPAHDKENA